MKLILIAGARPNFMKIAPLMSAITKQPSISPVLVHTGQHYDEKMSELFFRRLGIPKPDVNLGVGSASHAVQTAEIMTRFEPVLQQHKPDYVLVVGDVNSTIACSLVAAKLGIKIIHVEAGLRSFDRSMPKEITILKVPCLTLRENTERPCTIEMGTNQLVGTDPGRILEAYREGMHKASSIPPLWDGKAAERIVNVLKSFAAD
jgi:UDP-N-acetylglucosamine 2-epimerase